jgi:hypothetical protein
MPTDKPILVYVYERHLVTACAFFAAQGMTIARVEADAKPSAYEAESYAGIYLASDNPDHRHHPAGKGGSDSLSHDILDGLMAVLWGWGPK